MKTSRGFDSPSPEPVYHEKIRNFEDKTIRAITNENPKLATIDNLIELNV